MHNELLAARKSSEGLSPNSMAIHPVMRDLLGDGDPLVAFTRLEHRILETIELGDDITGIQAATYSLGLGSAGKTHLDRLIDYGRDYGYEARQARRHSDRGLRQLARLISSNWIVHTVPTLEIFLVQQSNSSFAVTLRATRQHHIDMRRLELFEVAQSGERRPLNLATTVAHEMPNGHVERVCETLTEPFNLKVPESGTPRHLRVEWPGEVWPRFGVSVIGALASGLVVTSQTVGNTVQMTVEELGK